MTGASKNLCNVSDPAHPLVKDAPLTCHRCHSPLCLRKQVMNLALGNTEEMYCLQCIAADSQQAPDEVLTGLMHYINQRDCFRKEWLRYTTVDFCPDQAGCLPGTCFATAEG